MSSPVGFGKRLIDAADTTAALVSHVLRLAEQLSRGGRHAGAARSAVDPEVLLEQVRGRAKPAKVGWHFETQNTADPDYDFKLLALRRVCALVSTALSGMFATPRSNRRPDVLALASQALANPEHPWSYRFTRFAIVSGLRECYRIPFTSECLGEMQRVYDDLVERFERKQARRQRRSSSNHENFIIDLLAFEGCIQRSLSRRNLEAYYQSFMDHRFGVGDMKRPFADSQEWPQLKGELPDFGLLVSRAFSQPIGVDGLDEVLGGLLPSVAAEGSGGLITLVAGTPGSGKTSLCLTLARRLGELGSRVAYLTTEESVADLKLKLRTIGEPSAAVVWPELESASAPSNGITFLPAGDLRSLTHFSQDLSEELKGRTGTGSVDSDGVGSQLPLPRVVVIDSVTALLSRLGGTEKAAARELLSESLANMRQESGLSIVLVGGVQDLEVGGLEYLVDNVFVLRTEDAGAQNRPMRVLAVQKTRLQASHRGRHVVHLSSHDGLAVSPSLNAVLQELHGRGQVVPDSSRVAVLSGVSSQLSLPIPSLRRPLISLRWHAQTLIYGHGSTGKARLGLALACEPRIPVDIARGSSASVRSKEIADWRNKTRLLVISFLYGEEYYGDLLKELQRTQKHEEGTRSIPHRVMSFYPGLLDAETLVAKIRKELLTGHLEGRPFTSVLVDGVHNVLLQFPLLDREPLLWPVLYRLFRTEGLDVVTTFTFFRVRQAQEPSEMGRLERGIPASAPDSPELLDLVGTEHLFFHLLVSTADYGFCVEREQEPPTRHKGRDLVRVSLVVTLDKLAGAAQSFFWDPEALRFESVPIQLTDATPAFVADRTQQQKSRRSSHSPALAGTRAVGRGTRRNPNER